MKRRRKLQVQTKLPNNYYRRYQSLVALVPTIIMLSQKDRQVRLHLFLIQDPIEYRRSEKLMY